MKWANNIRVRLFQSVMGMNFTVQIYLYLGIFWTLVSLFFLLLAESFLFLPAFVPGILDYGHLKPVSSLTLLFGSFLSFVLGIAYYILDCEKKVGKGCAGFAFVCMKLHHLAVLAGVAFVFMGASKGREFGEMPWLLDNLMMPAFLAFPIICIVTCKGGFGQVSSSLLLLLFGMSSGAVSYFLGNFNLPSGLLTSSPLFTGIEDAVVQELYRNGLLYFVILTSLFALLFYFIPLYYKVDLYSHSTALFVCLAFLFLVPLSVGSSLFHTAYPSLLQSLGIFLTIAVNFAVLAGGFVAKYTITRSSKSYRSDAIGVLLRSGLFFLLLMALGRMMLALPTIQAWLKYTSFTPFDPITNLQSYGLLIAFPLALVVLQNLRAKTYSIAIMNWLAFFWIMGVILLFIGNFVGGILEAVTSSAINVETKGLVHKEWEAIFFSGSFLDEWKKSFSIPSRYLIGLRGLSFIAHLFFLLGILLFSFSRVYAFLCQGRVFEKVGYSIPDIEYKEEREDA